MKYDVLNLGIIGYNEAYSQQQELIAKRWRNQIGDTILLLEHRPVITLGKGSHRENLLVSSKKLQAMGIEVVEIDRGGDVTLHSPGQLVCYLIFDLRQQGRDIHQYLRNLEEVIIQLLKDYEIQAEQMKGYTGVWVNTQRHDDEKRKTAKQPLHPSSFVSSLSSHKKIASIGIGVKHWISYHGVALNVNNDLSYFSLIHPCGMAGLQLTSMSRLLGEKVDITNLTSRLVGHFERVFL
ncbi:MAG: lipoyl(octanoyl) transferase LipB [Candidatus Latescibacteria bacterium]|nr:lipoyl(octanoyl) transferase LipB [Candidatus Latescibacterota bacterium]